MLLKQIKDYIDSNYSEERICELFDEGVFSGDWIDLERMKEECYDNEYEYYLNYGNGEVESILINDIILDLKKMFDIDSDTETHIYDYLQETYDVLHYI